MGNFAANFDIDYIMDDEKTALNFGSMLYSEKREEAQNAIKTASDDVLLIYY